MGSQRVGYDLRTEQQLRIVSLGDSPGGPVAKALCSHSRGPGFNPWLGYHIPHATAKDPAYQQVKIPCAATKAPGNQINILNK